MASKSSEAQVQCTECGNVFTFMRRSDRKKSQGHVKHLWCFVCETQTEHREITEE